MDLSAWMQKQELGDAELALRLGVTRSQVSRIRRGTSKPSAALAARLEQVTGIAAWDFLRPVEQAEAA